MDNRPVFRLGRKAVLTAMLVWGLVPKVDAQDATRALRPLPVRNFPAADLAPRLRDALTGLDTAAQVYVDSRENQLLVSGGDDVQRLAQQVLQALDQPSGATRAPGSTAPPGSANQVKGYPVGTDDLQAVAGQLREKYPAATGARVVVDERMRQVIVLAPAEVHQQIAGQLTQGQLMLRSTAGAQVVPGPESTYQLQSLRAPEFEEELQRLWAGKLTLAIGDNADEVIVSVPSREGVQPVLTINRRTDTVNFLGNPPSLETWRRFVQNIDGVTEGQSTTQLVPLQKADPANIKAAVAILRAKTPEKSGDSSAAVPLHRSARPRTASDLVSMIFQQGAEQPAAPPAANAPAPADAQADVPADAGESPEGGGLIGPVQIDIIEGLDVMIIKGDRRDVERVKKIIEEIERLSFETQPVVEVHPLKHVNSEAVAELVSALYTEILSPRQGQVSIRALVQPNALLLIGRKESVQVVRDLIDKLDQPIPPTNRFEVLRLKHISAVDAETTVRSFFVARPGQGTDVRAGLGTRVQVIADYRTNSLIVQASPRDLEEVRLLVSSIDIDQPSAQAELRVFRLKNALAQDLATVLQAAVSGTAATTTGTGQQFGGQQGGGQQGGGTATSTQTRLPSPSLEFMMIDQDGGRLLRGGILSDVIITPDTAINSLIVRAPARSMELVAALIEQLDRLPDVGSQIKVFTIVNGDATSLATTLQTLLGITTTTNQVTQTQGGLGITAQTLQAATAGGDTSIVPLRIAVDTRTNSIVATGSESDLNVIEVVLTRLDEEMQRRRLAVIRLRNTPAPNVAAAVTTYLTNQQTLIQQQLLNTQSISAYGRIEREVFVVAEEVSNSLIISASPQYFDEVVNMIQELDIRPPMVLVQVLIAEVRLDNIFEFGAEFGLQDSLVFDRGKALPVVPETPSVPGFNFGASPLPAYPNARSYQQETLAGQSITNFALGRTNGALGYGGLVLSAANESISILLRALQDDRRLQVLSRPQIMTMHNQPAYVQVGADVARISETTVTQNNVVISAPDRATGIILSILPLINDDGVVVLGVEAERSAVDNTTPGTQIGTDNNGNPITIPNVNLTRASTTISCTDGQTVVFAGLITNSRNVQLRRVPYLADVPVLGNLFQYQQDTQQRTELLIVMTPYIIRDDADAEMAKLRESERMSWCLSDVISVGGDPGLQGNNCLFCKTDTPVVYPDLDPTGSQAVSAPAMAKRDDPAAPTMATHGMAPLIPVPTPEILEPQPIPGAPAAVPVSNGGEHQLLPASGNYGPAPPAVNVAPANFQPANVKRLPAAN